MPEGEEEVGQDGGRFYKKGHRKPVNRKLVNRKPVNRKLVNRKKSLEFLGGFLQHLVSNIDSVVAPPGAPPTTESPRPTKSSTQAVTSGGRRTIRRSGGNGPDVVPPIVGGRRRRSFGGIGDDEVNMDGGRRTVHRSVRRSGRRSGGQNAPDVVVDPPAFNRRRRGGDGPNPLPTEKFESSVMQSLFNLAKTGGAKKRVSRPRTAPARRRSASPARRR